VPEFTWRPANEASTDDVSAVFDTGGAGKCRCQGLKTAGWIWRDTTQPQRDAALMEQTGCGTDGPTSGLIGYLDGEPAGWVAVEPRENYPRIWNRKQPWMRMDPGLDGVWSVTCFVVRKGFRRQGLMYELAAATVEYGRQVGARVLEGYPTEPAEGKTVIWDEASVGLLQVFLDAGYEVAASPTLRRRVVRLQLGGSPVPPSASA
jgi:GNAT superfamily N-acetyltransferase